MEDAELFRSVFQEARDALIIADDTGQCIAANSAAADLIGRPSAEITGTHIFQSIPSDDGAAWPAMLDGRDAPNRFVLTRTDGTTRDIELSLIANVTPGRHVAILRDVTEQERLQAALRQAEAKLRGILDSNLVNITFANDKGDLFEANDAFLQMVGYSRADLNAGLLRWTDITPEPFKEINLRAHEEVKRLGQCAPFEKQYVRRDGSRVWVLISLARLPSAKDHTISISVDITARKQIEQALIDSEHKFSTIFANSPLALYLAELTTGELIEANFAFTQLTGYAREEAVGRTIGDLAIWPDVRLRETLTERLRTDGGVPNVETTMVARNGKIRHVLVSLHALRLKTDPRDLILVAVVDVTDRRLLQEQFIQAQKMEAVGRLATGVAHDFNNLLTAIVGYSDLLAAYGDLSEQALADANQIQRAGRSAAALTRQLLAFSHRQTLQPKAVDVNAIVVNIDRLMRRLAGEDVEIVTDLYRPLPSVIADPTQIEQVIINLVANARDAMPSGGRLTIATSDAWLEDDYAQRHTGAHTGRYVLLAVNDTGIGMDKQVKARLFEPFFTTKERGKGTGLGLATIDGIVKQSGGYIAVESQPGRGATFLVYLPATDEVPAPIAPETSALTRLTGSETILIVEDQLEVRMFVRDALVRSGYSVLMASAPDDAVKLLLTEHLHVDLLLIDVVLPRMNGRQLARLLKASRPALRVLYMSGYADDAILQHGVLEPGLEFIQKPLSASSVLSRIRQVLDRDVPPDV